MAGLEDLLGGDLAKVPMIVLVRHLIGGQRVSVRLDRHVLVGDPNVSGFSSQPAFSIQPPVAEADISLLVDGTAGQQRGEDPGQILVADAAWRFYSRGPAGGAPSPGMGAGGRQLMLPGPGLLQAFGRVRSATGVPPVQRSPRPCPCTSQR